MAGILKRKKRLGRPRKSTKKTKKLDSKTSAKAIKSAASKKSKSTKKTKKSTKTTKDVGTKQVKEETTTAAPTKRTRGRPKKSKKTAKTAKTGTSIEDQHTITILEEETRPEKRGPGRPPKRKPKKASDGPKKRGRPKDSSEPKRGRPTKEEAEKKQRRGPGRPRKHPAKPKKKATKEKPKKLKKSSKTPNPLLEIMDNFRDDKAQNDDSSSDDELKDMIISDSMGTSDVMMQEESDLELMSNSDLDVDEIIKIDTTDSEELERELEASKGISEKQQMKEDVAEMEKQETICPECGSTKLINDHERGEVVCGACGLVIDDNIVDMGPEWRAFDHEQRDKRTRVGAPITYTIHDKGLSTMIDWRNKDIYGRDIPARNRAQWYRLRKWQRKIRISGATERNLAFALSELDRDSSRLGLPRSVRESASVVYRNAVENKLIRGRSIEGVVAASLYAACRRCKVPRTLDEIADVSRVSKKEVGRTYRFLTRELHIRLPPTSPIDYVPRFASELNLSGVVQSKAIEIINQAMENGLTSGRGPTGVAAAALYIASVILNERKTQRDVADIAGVTEVTIRNRYKELTEQLEMGVNL